MHEIFYEIIHKIKKVFNTFKLCKRELNKFALLLRIEIYPYKYMSHSILNLNISTQYKYLKIEGISYADYQHAKKTRRVLLK